MTVAAPRSRRRSAAARHCAGSDTGPRTYSASSQSLSLTSVGAAAQRGVQARAGEVDEHARAVGAGVGDEVAVQLERQRIAGERVGHDEPSAGDRLRAGGREQLVDLVPRRRGAGGEAEDLPLARAPVGDVAAALARRGHDVRAGGSQLPQQRREQRAASRRRGTSTGSARRPCGRPCGPPRLPGRRGGSGRDRVRAPSRSRVTVSNGCGAKTAILGAGARPSVGVDAAGTSLTRGPRSRSSAPGRPNAPGPVADRAGCRRASAATSRSTSRAIFAGSGTRCESTISPIVTSPW